MDILYCYLADWPGSLWRATFSHILSNCNAWWISLVHRLAIILTKNYVIFFYEFSLLPYFCSHISHSYIGNNLFVEGYNHNVWLLCVKFW